MGRVAFSHVDRLGAPHTAYLRDGSSVMIRACEATDEPVLRGFLSGLCLEARRPRFFSGAVDIDRAASMTAAAGPDRAGLVAPDRTARAPRSARVALGARIDALIRRGNTSLARRAQPSSCALKLIRPRLSA
jgi:hypothetical protein